MPTYNSLQALFKTRYKRSQLTAAYTWSHSIANVHPGRLLRAASDSRGFMYPGDPATGSWQFSDQPATHLHGELQLLFARPEPAELVC